MTVKALAGEIDGEVVGIGGYYIKDGVAVVFSDVRDGKVSRRDVVRGGRAIMDLVRKLGIEVAAIEGSFGDTALKHFGFENHGGCWVWSPK